MTRTETPFEIRNYAGTTRYDRLHGRKHLVVPLRMIVPGVLNGSRGALYYPPAEVAKNPEDWNGMPIVVYHPPTSARDPKTLEEYAVGTVFNARIEDGVLVADGWLCVKRLQQVDHRVYDSLHAGEPLEVSTGLFADYEEAAPGTVFNGRAYTHTVRNIRPDHLAILPDQVGACSLKDGCGAMANTPSILRKELGKRLRRAFNSRRNQSMLPDFIVNRFGLNPTPKQRFDADEDLMVPPTINWDEEVKALNNECGCGGKAQARTDDDGDILLPRHIR